MILMGRKNRKKNSSVELVYNGIPVTVSFDKKNFCFTVEAKSGTYEFTTDEKISIIKMLNYHQ